MNTQLEVGSKIRVSKNGHIAIGIVLEIRDDIAYIKTDVWGIVQRKVTK